MTSFNLEAVSIKPTSSGKPKQAVILCHGYGGSGKDISFLAMNWQRFLPDAIFLCPNAPEVCEISPSGFQWFDLSPGKEQAILEKSLIAEEKLNIFLDEVLNSFNLHPDDLSLVGFSQGCMMVVQVGLKKIVKINSIIGYSGKIINQENLSKNINSKPKIFLMHGDSDTIVSPMHLLESKEYLNKHGLKIKTKLFKNCEHHIPVEGSSLGLEFLRKNFYK
jgi:phospholipase/carboxylesterase